MEYEVHFVMRSVCIWNADDKWEDGNKLQMQIKLDLTVFFLHMNIE